MALRMDTYRRRGLSSTPAEIFTAPPISAVATLWETFFSSHKTEREDGTSRTSTRSPTESMAGGHWVSRLTLAAIFSPLPRKAGTLPAAAALVAGVLSNYLPTVREDGFLVSSTFSAAAWTAQCPPASVSTPAATCLAWRCTADTTPTACARQHFRAAAWSLKCRRSPESVGRTRRSMPLPAATMAHSRAGLLRWTRQGTFTAHRMV